MKRLITTFLLLFITVSLSAQSKEEKRAQKKTDEVEKVLSLDKNETEKVYTTFLAKEKKVAVLKEKYKDDQETFKTEMKALNKSTNRTMRELLGEERVQKIRAYFKAKREKSKN